MSSPSGYQESLERLFGLERGGGKLGLEGTRLLLRALQDPQDSFATVHIAGTNGKGSTACYIERLLRETGLRTGLFTSPHLVDFRERFRVLGEAESPQEILQDLEAIRSLPESRERTFFEVATALGFLHFARAGAEVVVTEVGMGGRLDCTNVIDSAVSVITPIAHDHTEVLGEELATIAREKAGILRKGVPVVVASQTQSVRKVLEQAAREAKAPFIALSDRVRLTRATVSPRGTQVTLRSKDFGRLRFLLRSIGRHQAQNAALAVATLGVALEQGMGAQNGTRFAMNEPGPSAIETALEKARWPGRLEVLQNHPKVWVDGAHNASGGRALLRAWRDGFSNAPATLVLACTNDKKMDSFLNAFQGPWRHVIATETGNPRAYPADRLARKAESMFGVAAEAITPVAVAIEKAIHQARGREHVLITGSLYLVGEALSILGVDPTQELT